jgi:hypothetical protein
MSTTTEERADRIFRTISVASILFLLILTLLVMTNILKSVSEKMKISSVIKSSK